VEVDPFEVGDGVVVVKSPVFAWSACVLVLAGIAEVTWEAKEDCRFDHMAASAAKSWRRCHAATAIAAMSKINARYRPRCLEPRSSSKR